MRRLSFLLVPSRGTRILRVRRGPGKGLVYELNPRWHMRMWEGSYEGTVQEVVLRTLKPGTVFYDVGASVGFYSLLAGRQGARVFAFEADPRIGQALTRHDQLNSLEAGIEIIRAAVFSTTGSISLEPASAEDGYGNAHVGTARDTSRPTVEVLCTTLDDFSQAYPAPDLIKIDVEGVESEVLKGAEKLFARARPLLICEVHDPANASFVESWLLARNYEIRWLEESELLPRQLLATPK